MMKFLLSPRFILSFALSSFLLIAGCNFRGLFVHLEDDPVFVDPAAPKEGTGNGPTTVGGPGAGVYAKICSSCHQGNGKGLSGVYPPLAGSAFANGESSVPIRIVLHGFKGKITREGKEYNGLMAPWKDVLSDQEIADVLTYVRSSFGNTGAAVTVDEVKAVREKTKSHMSGWDEASLQSPL
ncbi:MAG TPA: cytochrome c, partial [Saprospiraceae bacterium]|nr:cytochrome c [Saprospiraceae bacterium]